LKHITPEQGMDFLARLKLGTASRVPNQASLLVTGETDELRRARAVLELVDTRTEFEVARLGPASAMGTLSSNADIARAVGGLCIGTFAHPPKDRDKMRAIIDVHGGDIVAVAPAFQMKDVRLAAQLGAQVLQERSALSQPTGAPVGATIPAVAMLESSLDAPVPEGGNGSPSERLALSKEMQEKLRERYQRALEQRARSQAASQPDAQAMSTVVSDPSPVSGDAPQGQPDTNDVGVPVGNGLRQVGAAPDQNLPPEVVAEPVPAESAAAPAEPASLEPGQAVPVTPDRITQPKLEPKSMTDVGVADLAAETTASASPYDPPEFANGDQVVEVNLPASLPVIDLLDLVGKYLNLSYIYDPQKVTGVVTVKLNGDLQGRIKVKDLYLFLESALQERELVMTRHKGNIVRIVSKLDALAKGDPKLVGFPGQTVEAGDAVVTHVFKLKYIDNSSAENLLKAMGLSVTDATSISESRTLIVTAYAHRMARIQQLLELVDRPGTPRTFKYRQLQYTMAKELADKVKALAEQLENVTVTVGAPEVPATVMAQQPGESDVQYRTRMAQYRMLQNTARAQQAAARGQTPEETKRGVYLDADERTNRILMIGEEEQLTKVDALVDALDVAQQDLRALQLYRMKFVDAEEVAHKLFELGMIARMPETSASQRYSQYSPYGQAQRLPGQQPGQPRITQANVPEATVQVAAELTEEGLVGKPQVVVIESNNSLLVNGTPEQHAKIASIIEYVDTDMDMEEMPYRIYPLENSSPNHLAEILEGLIQETQEQNRDGKIEKVVMKRQEEITIMPDPNTYSLVVYASKKNQEWISNLVKQLDKRRPQVLIDVTLVEITKNDSFEYDLDVVQSFPDLLNTSGQVGGLPAGVLAGLTGAGAQDRFIDMESGKTETGTQQFRGYYADKHIGALLTAMQKKGYGRVLAKPKLLVNDNEPGTIKTLKTTYVETQSSIPVNTAGTGTQASVPTFTTSVDFTPYEAGIEMNITPHISEGDLLRLVIGLTRSDFITATGEKPPDKTGSELTTAVTVPDGSTVILGGMLDLRQDKNVGKVPLLGDLPVVGGLFRNVKNTGAESKLYVFVKAEVIRPAGATTHGMEDLQKISDVNREAFEKHELQFQQYQSWPGVKPKPIDPPKVLDAR